jgi:hypothetical protein
MHFTNVKCIFWKFRQESFKTLREGEQFRPHLFSLVECSREIRLLQTTMPFRMAFYPFFYLILRGRGPMWAPIAYGYPGMDRTHIARRCGVDAP